MADPVSLSALAIGGMAAGGAGSIVNAIGQVFSGQSQGNMYAYQAGVATMNKNIALQNADYARIAGEVSAQESGMKTRAVVGEQKAMQGRSGLDVNRGSLVQVRTSQLEVGAEDEAIIRSNAARKAYGYDVEAAQSEAQSRLYTAASSGAKTAGWIGAAGSILGGASSVSSKWLDYQKNFGNTGGGSSGGGESVSVLS